MSFGLCAAPHVTAMVSLMLIASDVQGSFNHPLQPSGRGHAQPSVLALKNITFVPRQLIFEKTCDCLSNFMPLKVSKHGSHAVFRGFECCLESSKMFPNRSKGLVSVYGIDADNVPHGVSRKEFC